MQSLEPNHTIVSLNDEPSKWWSWGLAILILIWSVLGALGGAVNYYLANSGFYDNLATDAKRDIGPYPENGTSAEQQEWNETNEFLDLIGGDLHSIYQPELQLQFSLITLLAGFVACFLLFTRDPNGFKAAGIWLAVVATTGIILQVIGWSQINDFYEQIPGVNASDASLMSGIAMGAGIGGSLTCYLSLFALIYVAARKSKVEEKITESGFHYAYNSQEE
jgi:hypothetical protein